MSLRLDGLLDTRTQTELEQHIKTCARCLTEWTALQEADSLLRMSARRPVTPAPDFVARVMVRVAATPVARPALWDRVRVEGGRRTMPLALPERRATAPLRGSAPLGVPVLAEPLTGWRGVLAALQNRAVQAYLGGAGVAIAFAMLTLAVLTSFVASNGLPGLPVVNLLPGVAPALDVGETGLTALGHVFTAWLAQVDLVLVGGVAVVVAACAALWAGLVRRYGRRDASGRIRA
jgi:anti-sigma factor RsiW